MELRPFGNTGIMISPLGLGTVKFGRNEQVKYPLPFEIPKDSEVSKILSVAYELGINVLDTAPAYGNSQERIGSLLPGRRDEWIIISKIGEQFINGESIFDFTKKKTIKTIETSLKKLKTNYIDCILIHSNGDDLAILENSDTLEALNLLKDRGYIRSFGMSTKTTEGGLKAIEYTDAVMVTCNIKNNKDKEVLQLAEYKQKGVLIKKGLMSGHFSTNDELEDSMRFVFNQPGVNSLIVGTINLEHLKTNASIVEKISR